MQWDGPGLVVKTEDVLKHFLQFVETIHEYAMCEVDMELEFTEEVDSEASLEDKFPSGFGIEPWVGPRQPGSTKRDFALAFQLQEDHQLARALEASLQSFQQAHS
tara:strand:- start:34 stop:348 length:315 start_codon:yes stop_codon:yes gene_type:complete